MLLCREEGRGKRRKEKSIELNFVFGSQEGWKMRVCVDHLSL
jgi:hypothetical protein